jgi:hypothetical protein
MGGCWCFFLMSFVLKIGVGCDWLRGGVSVMRGGREEEMKKGGWLGRWVVEEEPPVKWASERRRRANLLRAKLKSVSKSHRVLALYIPGGSAYRAGGLLAQTK